MIRTSTRVFTAVILIASLVACGTKVGVVEQRSLHGGFRATVADATRASEEVLEELGLNKISRLATMTYVEVVGYTTDNTKVTVSIQQDQADPSTVNISTSAASPDDTGIAKQVMLGIKGKLS